MILLQTDLSNRSRYFQQIYFTKECTEAYSGVWLSISQNTHYSSENKSDFFGPSEFNQFEKTKTMYMTYGRRLNVDYIIIMKAWLNQSTRSYGAPVACTMSRQIIQSRCDSPKFRKRVNTWTYERA